MEVQIGVVALTEPDFCERLVTIFNDKDEENSQSLENCIADLPGIEKLKHKPKVKRNLC